MIAMIAINSIVSSAIMYKLIVINIKTFNNCKVSKVFVKKTIKGHFKAIIVHFSN